MKTKDILLIVAMVWFAFYGTIALIGEPTPNSFFDSVVGIIIMKLGAIFNLALVYCAYKVLSDDAKTKMKDWFKKINKKFEGNE